MDFTWRGGAQKDFSWILFGVMKPKFIFYGFYRMCWSPKRIFLWNCVWFGEAQGYFFLWILPGVKKLPKILWILPGVVEPKSIFLGIFPGMKKPKTLLTDFTWNDEAQIHFFRDFTWNDEAQKFFHGFYLEQWSPN